MEYSGKEIKALRNTLGMSQTEFGEALGVTKLTVINWELGKTGIKKESVKKQLHEFMEKNNIANATDVFNGVEVVVADDNNRLSTVNCPYEIFEPRIFPSVFEKFICNPDISEQEKKEAIRSIQRKILDYEDGTYINISHIWPDQYIAQFHNAASSLSSNNNSLFGFGTDNKINNLGIDHSLIGKQLPEEKVESVEPKEELEKIYPEIDRILNMDDPASIGVFQSIATSASEADDEGAAQA